MKRKRLLPFCSIHNEEKGFQSKFFCYYHTIVDGEMAFIKYPLPGSNVV